MTTDQQSSSQRAYQFTKDQILTGEMRGGQLLSEVEVAARIGVSRTPVHEAFLRLAAEDLLELVSRRGAVVAPISSREATDLLEMRLALETAAVRRLCRSAGSMDSLVADLTVLVDEQRDGVAAGDLRQFAIADDAFHRCIVDAAGNSIGQRFYCSLSDRQRRMLADAVRADPARLARLIGEHGHLAEAIGHRDAQAFEAALLVHLEATYQVTLA